MEVKQKLQMIDEIRKIERELYLKKSQLAAAESREHSVTLPSLLIEGLDTKEWKKAFSGLIEKIGLLSGGGNSVEDVKMERQR